jgi:hypothetical protein
VLVGGLQESCRSIELDHCVYSQELSTLICMLLVQNRLCSAVHRLLLTTGTTGLPPLSLPLTSCHCCPFSTIAPGAAGSNSAVAADAVLEAPAPCCCFCSAPGRKPPAALRPAVGLKAGIAAAEKGLEGAWAASLQASVKQVPCLAGNAHSAMQQSSRSNSSSIQARLRVLQLLLMTSHFSMQAAAQRAALSHPLWHGRVTASLIITGTKRQTERLPLARSTAAPV